MQFCREPLNDSSHTAAAAEDQNAEGDENAGHDDNEEMEEEEQE